MSAATFTPGPWRPFLTSDGETWILDDPPDSVGDNSVICVVDGLEDGPRYRSRKQAEANARLIAAAPELLEACKLAFARLKPGDIRKDFAGHVAVAAMSKAIAKAEGSAD